MIDIRARLNDTDEARLIVLPVTMRAKGDGDEAPALEGHAALFDDWTQIGGDSWGFMESIAPGAFRKSLEEDDYRSFFNHDSNIVLGRKSAKTAVFEEDEKGLRTLIYPPDTAHGRDVVTLVKRGDVTGMSFMFRTKKDEWTEPEQKGELPKRRLLEVQLFEAGPVTFPAYEATSISARDRAKSLLDARAALDRMVPVPADVLARRREAQRLAFELACEAIAI